MSSPKKVSIINCPHCSGHTRVTKTQAMSDTMKEITYQCQNDECGHVFVAALEVLRTVSLSSKPKQGVHIPFSESLKRAIQRQLNIDAPA
jgi:hypothetical protein